MQKTINKKIVNAPWGNFEEFCENTRCTVKILNVKPHGKLSLQKHGHRSEFWKVIFGSGTVVLGNKRKNAVLGKEFRAKKGEKHRIIASADGIRVLEISFGHFDEKDITRIKDKYKRK